jgi:hypothetical protein
MLAESEFDLGRIPVPLLVGIGVAAAGWLLLLGGYAVATRPLPVRPGPGSLDLGAEPPAVVNLLAGGWRMTTDAVSGTLLDLAARGLVDLDQHGPEPERTVIRLRAAPEDTPGAGHGNRPGDRGGTVRGGRRPGDRHGNRPGELTAYERRVYQRIVHLAVGGVVPAAALATGSGAHAAAWWHGFRREVIRDAQQRGLSRNRWGRSALVLLNGVAAVPATLAAVALGRAFGSAGPAIVPGFLLWFLLSLPPRKLNRQRDTATGRAAAARWLGVRDHLARDEAFERLPPAAVAIWDRHLAYAAAMGVAETATRVLPFGAQDERLAWSAYGGSWHRVRIRYPGRRLVEGRHPAGVAFCGLLAGAAGYGGIRLAQAARDRLDNGTGVDLHAWDLHLDLGARLDSDPGRLALTGLTAFGAVLILWGGYTAVRGIADLTVRRTVDGEVLRVREHTTTDDDANTTVTGYEMAIDDGRHPRIRAWPVASQVGSGVRQGNVVRATYGPRLRYVYRLEVIEAGRAPEYAESTVGDLWPAEVLPEQPSPAAVAARHTVATVDPGTLLTAGELSAALGRRFGPPSSITGAGPAPLLGHRMCQYQADGDRAQVLVQTASGWLARRMATADRRSVPLPGLGDSARLRGESVTVQHGEFGFGIMLRHVDPATARTALPWLAQTALGRLPPQPPAPAPPPTGRADRPG